ncbi:heme NO-binding domain-containing protein [Celeribacter indicus]|uniref:Heme NO binding domain-containing protein n=1 Tax=Celeribacter indicus TaxID=1208324 RepID=A0A0B5E6V7_9RHOB|nr:heme NO-binding domain-containing protein [Celeribacter indicus]AJE48057.1 heme NO binding domain-containing protein [Celeribacter indicus]SDW31275.1 Haem-NO-binding [Celeribacter indicus]
MHGMINRAIQCFLRDTYGPRTWQKVAENANLGFDNFEAMLSYPDQVTLDVLGHAARHLHKPVETFLEDLGTYLVSHPNVEAIRRLLRFGGENFTEFLFSLNEIEGRVRLALPDLDVPALSVEANADGTFRLICSNAMPGFGYAVVGVMRAMADDYGALVFLEHEGWRDSGEEAVTIHLLETAYAQGRSFDLSGGVRGVA